MVFELNLNGAFILFWLMILISPVAFPKLSETLACRSKSSKGLSSVK